MGILTDDMKRVVEEQRLGFVATVCPDGTPNLSPKGTTAVWDDDHLMFANLCSPGTLRNLAQNPAVEVNVVDMALRKGYRFKGSARIVTGGPLYDRLRARYESGPRALEPELCEQIDGIVLIAVEHAAPVISPVYDGEVTESEVGAQYAEYWRALWSVRTGRP